MIKEVIPIPIIPNDKSWDRSLTQALDPHRPRRAGKEGAGRGFVGEARGGAAPRISVISERN